MAAIPADTAYAIAYLLHHGKQPFLGPLWRTPTGSTATDFERQFAATIYIPNVKHYLNVQKLDDNNDPVNGVTFALYKKDDLTRHRHRLVCHRERKPPYDTVTTGDRRQGDVPVRREASARRGQILPR